MKKRFIKAISIPIVVFLLGPILVLITAKWATKENIMDYVVRYINWLEQ